MEKILIAIDGINPDRDTLTFGCFLARLTSSEITGVFLENLVAEERPVVKKMYDGSYFGWEVDDSTETYHNRMKLIDQNIKRFKDFYGNHGINSSVHRDRGIPAKEIIEETRYTDLLVVDAETSFKKNFEGLPTSFVKEILAEAECPVIISPGNFEGIDEIVFTYSGSKSSVFAIKQFTYLFPQFRNKNISIVQVKEENQTGIDKYKLKEWLKSHYVNFHFEELGGDTETELFGYLLKKKKVFIVLGAYGRSMLSRIIRRSHADIVIRTITQPIFIAHY